MTTLLYVHIHALFAGCEANRDEDKSEKWIFNRLCGLDARLGDVRTYQYLRGVLRAKNIEGNSKILHSLLLHKLW